MIGAMDANFSLQDIVRCHLCENPDPSLYCSVCLNNICGACKSKHTNLGKSKDHEIVPFRKRRYTYKCPKHSTKICEMFCEDCNVSMCDKCDSSGEHKKHKQVDILKRFEFKKEDLQTDFQELQKSIYPIYQEIASYVALQKANVYQNSQKLTTVLNNQGEKWHREIDDLIEKLKSDFEELDSKHLAVVVKQEKEITTRISEISKCIVELETLIESTDVRLVSSYKSKNAEFRKLPPKLTAYLPSFIPPNINREQLYQQFLSLSKLSFKTEEHGYTMNCPVLSPPERPMMAKPRIVTDIATHYTDRGYNNLLNVSCLTDEEIWMHSDTNIMTLYDLQGKVVQSIKTKSGHKPRGIAVTKGGHLVYIDSYNRTVYTIFWNMIHEVVKIHEWEPISLCCTSADELLVIMDNEDHTETRIVRYRGEIEKQIIESNDKGRPLYLPWHYRKFLCENGNLDVCVTDSDAGALVVVNQAGILRFRYTGFSTNNQKLLLTGIATDSQCRILTADLNKSCIHIIDQDGHFLRYIDMELLVYIVYKPWSLCTDSKDNLYVTYTDTGLVRKIQYYMPKD